MLTTGPDHVPLDDIYNRVVVFGAGLYLIDC